MIHKKKIRLGAGVALLWVACLGFSGLASSEDANKKTGEGACPVPNAPGLLGGPGSNESLDLESTDYAKSPFSIEEANANQKKGQLLNKEVQAALPDEDLSNLRFFIGRNLGEPKGEIDPSNHKFVIAGSRHGFYFFNIDSATGKHVLLGAGQPNKGQLSFPPEIAPSTIKGIIPNPQRPGTRGDTPSSISFLLEFEDPSTHEKKNYKVPYIFKNGAFHSTDGFEEI